MPICRTFVKSTVGNSTRVEWIREAAGRRFGRELVPNAARRAGVGEEDGAERDNARPCSDELERVVPAAYAAHSDDWHVDGAGTGRDACERDGAQRRPRIAAEAARQLRAERVRVERHPAERVDERQSVRARGDDRPRV